MTDLRELLEKTSRTFALAIPLLPEPTRTDITLAYLVFRIADTLEDAKNLEQRQRIQALREFSTLLEFPTAERAQKFTTKWASQEPTTDPWYHALLLNTPFVLEQLGTRDERLQLDVRRHAQRTTSGMASLVTNVALGLKSLNELRRYCYVVAGVVGEMLTDIFARRIERFEASDETKNEARAFGEALQLVNILKDAKADRLAGRLFLPDSLAVSDVFDLARQDFQIASRYVQRLVDANAPPGYIAFSQMPLTLGHAALDCVERLGPGSKLTRGQIQELVGELTGGVVAQGEVGSAAKVETRNTPE